MSTPPQEGGDEGDQLSKLLGGLDRDQLLNALKTLSGVGDEDIEAWKDKTREQMIDAIKQRMMKGRGDPPTVDMGP